MKDIVLNEGYGITLNKIWHNYNAIKTPKQQKKWENDVKNVKFGTYGTIHILEVLENFKPKWPNEILKNDFIREIKLALNTHY